MKCYICKKCRCPHIVYEGNGYPICDCGNKDDYIQTY